LIYFFKLLKQLIIEVSNKELYEESLVSNISQYGKISLVDGMYNFEGD
jgi:hypothetical protein